MSAAGYACVATLWRRTIACITILALVPFVVAFNAAAAQHEGTRISRHSVSRLLPQDQYEQPSDRRYGRKLSAVAEQDDALDIDFQDPHENEAHLANIDHIDLAKEDEEDEALLGKTKDIFAGKKLHDTDHEMPLTFKDLGPITKGLGLSDEDLKDLDNIETGKVTLLKVGSQDKKDPDERPRDIPPPPGMVANPRDMKALQAGMDLDPAAKVGEPHAPIEPKSHLTNNSQNTEDGVNSGLLRENAEYEERIVDLSKKLKVAQSETNEVKRDVAIAQRETSALNVQLDRSKSAFQRSLESAREEERSKSEDMSATIKEQKRAFDELFEEKQLLSQMLSDEQRTLKELQEKIQHPDLGLWVRQRAEKAAILVETPETDAVKYYAKKYMAPKVTKMRHRLELLEKRVERTVDHLLPAKYGNFVALLLSLGLVGFPFLVTMSTVVSVTKSVSPRQYVLLGNVFLTAFAFGLCVAGVLLRQDPLQTLYEASETLFITLQLTAAVAFPVFLGVIGCTVAKSRDRLDAFVFGCEFVFYSLVAMNYRSRVWRPAMLGQNIETSAMMYAIYLMDFMSMTALTVSSARVEGAMATGDVDPEVGLGSKAVGITGTGPLNESVSSRVSSLGGGLLQAAMGQNGRTGKEE